MGTMLLRIVHTERTVTTMDELTLTFNSPLTEEDWDVLEDVDFDRTDRVWFHTKHGKDVEFVKVVRCADCVHCQHDDMYGELWCDGRKVWRDHFCSCGKRKESDNDV